MTAEATQRIRQKPVRGPVMAFWLFLGPAMVLLLVTRIVPVGEALVTNLNDPESGSFFGAYKAPLALVKLLELTASDALVQLDYQPTSGP